MTVCCPLDAEVSSLLSYLQDYLPCWTSHGLVWLSPGDLQGWRSHGLCGHLLWSCATFLVHISFQVASPSLPRCLCALCPPVRLPAALGKSLALSPLQALSKQLQLFGAAFPTRILRSGRMRSLWMPWNAGLTVLVKGASSSHQTVSSKPQTSLGQLRPGTCASKQGSWAPHNCFGQGQ